jgi:hypothetical protein
MRRLVFFAERVLLGGSAKLLDQVPQALHVGTDAVGVRLISVGEQSVPSVERSEGITGFGRWGDRVEFQL